MTPLLAQGDSSITDTDRKIEALLQLHENKLMKLRLFELENYKKDIGEYMKGRDFLISELYDEVWIQQQMNEVKQADINKQILLIGTLEEENQNLSRKNKNKTWIIISMIAFNLTIVSLTLVLN